MTCSSCCLCRMNQNRSINLKPVMEADQCDGIFSELFYSWVWRNPAPREKIGIHCRRQTVEIFRTERPATTSQQNNWHIFAGELHYQSFHEASVFKAFFKTIFLDRLSFVISPDRCPMWAATETNCARFCISNFSSRQHDWHPWWNLLRPPSELLVYGDSTVAAALFRRVSADCSYNC